MKDKKSRIDTYNTPYDIDIVIANRYTTLEELNELYELSDGKPLEEDLLETIAFTATVARKSDNHRCVLVKYCRDNKTKGIDKLLDIISTADHEAIHILMDIYYDIHEDVDLDHQEVFAYQHSYITTLILKNWLNR